MHKYVLLLATLAIVGCQQAADETAAEEAPAAGSAGQGLAASLDAQSAEVKARYKYRHPQETLEFFGIEPGMTLVEGLPGRGWYTRVLLPYLGEDGRVIAASYALDMFALFPFANEEFMARQQSWATDWPAEATEWGGENGASVTAFHFGSMPEEFEGTADVAFFPRVLHNLARFQSQGDGDYLDTALADTYRALKPGGVLGVVQHHARDEMPDDWANGANGYLKKQFVIDQVKAAGFEFIGESGINANPNDQPTTENYVWRLPPSYNDAGDDPKLRAEVDAIGESNRMTLKFRKPNQDRY